MQIPCDSAGSREPPLISFDEESNALDYLRKAVSFIEEARDDPTAWKWVSIAMHGALYGFAVCASKTGRFAESTTGGEGEKLLSVRSVLERCKDKRHMNFTVDAKPLKISKRQDYAINFLKDRLRDPLEHFIPGQQWFKLEGLPETFQEVLSVISFLALDTNTFVLLEEKQQVEVEQLVRKGQELLSALALEYEQWGNEVYGEPVDG